MGIFLGPATLFHLDWPIIFRFDFAKSEFGDPQVGKTRLQPPPHREGAANFGQLGPLSVFSLGFGALGLLGKREIFFLAWGLRPRQITNNRNT